MSQADFPGSGDMAPSHESRIGNGMVGSAKRPCSYYSVLFPEEPGNRKYFRYVNSSS